MSQQITEKLLCSLFALILTVGLLSCTKGKEVGHDSAAPDFTASDLNGNSVKLSDMKGRVVMLEFWATWCPPCRESIPDLNKLHELYKDKGFTVLAVSVDKGLGASELKEFIKANDISYPVVLDSGKASSSYKVGSIPTSFIIDKDGRISSKHIGYDHDLVANLSMEIEALLNK